jgi:hypothetical protein
LAFGSALGMMTTFDLGREMLKWIAMITMTIDHVGAILYPEYAVLRVIGRLSFPLFAYLIVLGVKTTRNIKHYFVRLFLFALISQIPFYLALGIEPLEHLNIFFTLSFGVMFIYFIEKRSVLSLVPVLASLLNFDYNVYGIALIGCMYLLEENVELGVVSICLVNLPYLLAGSIQGFSVLALPIILLHRNGVLKMNMESKRKTAVIRKYIYYSYYPLHLALLYLIKLSYFQ